MGKLTKRVENENAYLSYRIKIQKTLCTPYSIYFISVEKTPTSSDDE